ncbi:hypothetical protein V8D89_009432 [Ganoderma adspersum]
MDPPSISRDPQEAPNGWITDIPAHVTIHKERAIRVYLLNPSDLDDVPFEDGFNKNSQRYFNAYKERDIEWRAWEVHGGPIEYWQFLKRRSQTPNSFLSNLLPYSYRRGARYDLHLTAPPALQDRYVGNSPILHDAKRALTPWIWDVCNAVLDDVLLDGQTPVSAQDLTQDREEAMKLAVSFVSTHHRLYAGRPDEALRPSPSVKAFRKVLSEAPVAPKLGSAQWGAAVQGLDVIRTEVCDYYDWNVEYLERVFSAARAVVQERGVDDDGWLAARWEVYDKYSLSLPLGLCYDRDEKAWFDDAADWLDARVSAEEMRGHIFGKCAAGIAFNKLLPELLSPSTSS